jgi:hypothetical protein
MNDAATSPFHRDTGFATSGQVAVAEEVGETG